MLPDVASMGHRIPKGADAHLVAKACIFQHVPSPLVPKSTIMEIFLFFQNQVNDLSVHIFNFGILAFILQHKYNPEDGGWGGGGQYGRRDL